ncbi:MAG TPA: formate dehydrogenase accessory sulfurtransferase FdhD [Spirochaetota bacterium]|nr:formate dehydrogenase accessory sulfurtransferase FdhD [Spirochaetota bacterium]HPF07180.1 formate dehydrogenase accessory sulfurtransferase FdhD [Spirochaetota bacterium]HPJ41615.1 formate dehydrogenase accessory sulfurtransferase FdhD [Spirochaetota bacterium]HPR36714.1 formate dehydrogenase accessory sulfurtransferase FdhD [Spirochaetota bacterium]HRX48541.1 formate dehydrogenase accessory sulfurtransferase FdhD [Spirochaetota bacterium]
MHTAKRKVIRFSAEKQYYSDDEIIKEEPLVINVNGERAYFCMRLPGMDRELTAGILYNDGLISSPQDIKSIVISGDSVETEITGAAPSEVKRVYSSTGGMSTSDLLRPAVAAEECDMSPDDLFRMKGEFLLNQKFFERTGGTHCAALFGSNGEMIAFAEDVGRHNALDKCAGSMLLAGRQGDAAVVVLSSRLSLEMIKKSYRTGALIVAGVSAPTSAAVEAADSSGITLIGFMREKRFNLYTHPRRIKGITA